MSLQINNNSNDKNAFLEKGSAGDKDLITEERDNNPMICEIDSGLLLVHGRMDERRRSPLTSTHASAIEGSIIGRVGPSHSIRGKVSSGG